MLTIPNYGEFHGELLMEPEEWPWLLDLIRRTDGPYLEVGTGDGVFAALCARAIPGKQVWCVDSFTAAEGTRAGDRKAWEANRADCPEEAAARMFLLAGKSGPTLKRMKFEHANRFGVALIDGDHSLAACLMDACGVWELVKPGGYIVFHDTHLSHIAAAASLFAATPQRDMSNPPFLGPVSIQYVQKADRS